MGIWSGHLYNNFHNSNNNHWNRWIPLTIMHSTPIIILNLLSSTQASITSSSISHTLSWAFLLISTWKASAGLRISRRNLILTISALEWLKIQSYKNLIKEVKNQDRRTVKPKKPWKKAARKFLMLRRKTETWHPIYLEYSLKTYWNSAHMMASSCH